MMVSVKSRMVRLARALIASALIPLCSCAASETPRETPPAGQAGQLSIGLFRELAAEQQGNVVFSPYSLEAVLRLMEQGAAGDTKEQLERLPMGTPGVSSAMDIRSACALFIACDLRLKGSFRDVICAPFATDPAAAIRQINGWCSAQTGGNISTLVSEATITPQTRLVAANAVYLKEAWLRPFEAHNTRPQAFTREDGSTRSVPMMQLTDHFAYAEGEDWKAIALPYLPQREGEPGCMIAVLPAPPLRDFVSGLTTEKWESIRAALAAAEPREVCVTLPKFQLRSATFSLRPAMESLGMKALFEQGNWSNFAAEPLMLDDVLQRCYVEVNEEGTEAAAVTVGIVVKSALRLRQASICFDRPFLWVVGDLHTSAPPFFMGIIRSLPDTGE